MSAGKQAVVDRIGQRSQLPELKMAYMDGISSVSLSKSKQLQYLPNVKELPVLIYY